LLVPIGSLIAGSTGNWYPIFMIAIAFDWIGALLALFVLKPLRKRWLETHKGEVPVLALG
jgi:OFA family oxalate/formate antiporter-like MFS transporter